jgi:hypothetical protein
VPHRGSLWFAGGRTAACKHKTRTHTHRHHHNAIPDCAAAGCLGLSVQAHRDYRVRQMHLLPHPCDRLLPLFGPDNAGGSNATLQSFPTISCTINSTENNSSYRIVPHRAARSWPTTVGDLPLSGPTATSGSGLGLGLWEVPHRVVRGPDFWRSCLVRRVSCTASTFS